MGKRKEKDKKKDLKSDLLSESKRQKKQKKHRRKKEKLSHSDNEEIDVVNDDFSRDDGGKALKLKIKFAGKTISTTEFVSDSGKEDGTTDDPDDSQPFSREDGSDVNNSDSQQRTIVHNEEDIWLDALEKGELDDTGGLKKKKNVSLMTARQRALHGETKNEATELIQLPMYPEKTDEDTEEEERRKKLRAKKRRQQLQKQVEETKSQTIEKLLTKSQKTKKLKSLQQNYISGPHFRYQDNRDGITLSYTEELEFPMAMQSRKSAPAVIKCSANGCHNNKKYNCSKTNQPVCSLQCYKIVNENHMMTCTMKTKYSKMGDNQEINTENTAVGQTFDNNTDQIQTFDNTTDQIVEIDREVDKGEHMLPVHFLPEGKKCYDWINGDIENEQKRNKPTGSTKPKNSVRYTSANITSTASTVSTDDRNMITKLLNATENGDFETVKMILSENPLLINRPDTDGYRALHRACYSGHEDILLYLIQRGANLSSQTNDGWQPIHCAARWNQLNICKILLERNVDVNAKTNGLQTPLHFAANSSESQKLLELLLLHPSIQPDIKNSAGDTAYDLAYRNGPHYKLFEMVEPGLKI